MTKSLLAGALLLVLAVVPLSSMTPGYGASEDLSLFMSSKENNNYLLNNLKLWFQLDVSSEFSLYVRGKHQYARLLNAADGTSSADSRQSVLDLDLGYFSWRNEDVALFAGRSLMTLGSGLLFDGAADGLDLRLSAGPLDLRVFGAYTGFIVGDSNPYNFSRQDISDGAKRLFGGLSCAVEFGAGWSLTANGLIQRDQGDVEASRYDTAHLSLALEGALSPAVTLSLEGALQGGEGPESTGTSMREISAWALTFRMQFALLDQSETAFAIDAAMATGSDNRYEHTPGGLDGEGRDTQFYSFGTYSTGFAFEPDLSNLIYAALSFTTMPFSQGSMFGRSRFTLKTSLYFKTDKAGPTSELATTDTRNNPASAFLGFAADATWAWRVVSDVSLVFAAGVFKPGTAWTDRTLESLIQTTVVFAF